MRELSPESVVVYGGRELNSTDAVAAPIFQTANFESPDEATFAARATQPMQGSFYTRYGNPTLQQAASVIADLESAECALVFASGVGATATTLLAFLAAGDHVIAPREAYTGTSAFLVDILAKFGVLSTFVEQGSVEEFESARRPNTRMIWVETPTNPLLKVSDLSAISQLARDKGILTVCDNTVATPINQKPLSHGIDLVMHSATKTMGGHSDIIAGAVAGRRALIERIWAASIVVGATLGPFDAWLLLRGLRTLPLRVNTLDKNALAVATYLEAHPRVSRVYYPGLASHPQHKLAKRQMKGFGCVLSFEVDGGSVNAEAFIRNLQTVIRAASLGGVCSTALRPRAAWSVHDSIDALNERGVSESLVRLSVGIECKDDLIADIDQALAAL